MNKRQECSLETFLSDVKDHKLTILRDEGLYRHLVLEKPKNGWDQRFEIVTFPGTLVYTGDMGTYVFARIPDMFQFFRRHKDRPIQINPHYWQEKCQASDRDGIKQYDADAFREYVRGVLDSGEASDELRELVDETVLVHADDGEILAKAALFEFRDDVESADRFRGFEDLEGFDPTVYTFRYLWCCFAMVWAIDQYDEEMQQRATLTGRQARA